MKNVHDFFTHIQNERYSFLLLLPNTISGLKQLLTEFDPATIPTIVDQLEEQSIDISMPKFDFDSTSGAEKMLVKSGLTSIFTKKADFSGISVEQKLHVAELQQHVTVRVDEGSSSENFLTASNALRSNAQPERSIAVNRPFLFFVRDVIENVIIIAGKLTDPPTQDEPRK